MVPFLMGCSNPRKSVLEKKYHVLKYPLLFGTEMRNMTLCSLRNSFLLQITPVLFVMAKNLYLTILSFITLLVL